MGQTFWSVPFFVRFERKGHWTCLFGVFNHVEADYAQVSTFTALLGCLASLEGGVVPAAPPCAGHGIAQGVLEASRAVPLEAPVAGTPGRNKCQDFLKF